MASPRTVEAINSRIILEVFWTIDGDHNQSIAIEGRNCYFSQVTNCSKINHFSKAVGWSFHNSSKKEDLNISHKKGEVGKTGMLF